MCLLRLREILSCNKMPRKYYDSSSEEESSSRSQYSSSRSSSGYYNSSSDEYDRSPSPIRKRAKTSYQFFTEKERKKIVKEHPKWDFAKINKELGRRWRRLDESQRKRFQRMANKDK